MTEIPEVAAQDSGEDPHPDVGGPVVPDHDLNVDDFEEVEDE